MEYITNTKVTIENNYPYAAEVQSCSRNKFLEPKYKIKNFTHIESYNMYQLIRAVHLQPVTVAFYASNKFFDYEEGVIDHHDYDMCPPAIKGTNHAVLLVGYTLNESGGTLIFKNSWGIDWGENGYFRFQFDNKEVTLGPCNVLRYGWKILSPQL